MEVVNSKLADALAKAQGAIQAAEKTQENTFFSKAGKKATYADIADVIEVIKKPASENGLSVTFNFKTENEFTFIQYKLRHSSGELEASDWLTMYMKDKSAHGFGAANTYYRRQLLKSIYQIPEEDDDGNEASQGKKPKQPNEPDKGQKPMALMDQLIAIANAKKMGNPQVNEIIKRVVGAPKKAIELDSNELAAVIEFITKFKT